MYRLIVSALAVPWKAYIMSTDHYLFSYLMTKDQECFFMNIFISYTIIAYTIYHTGGSLLRYWYVKASLRPEVAEVFMRKKNIGSLSGNSSNTFTHASSGCYSHLQNKQ